MKIHVSNDIKTDTQYYVERGNKKIHFQDLIFDELNNEKPAIYKICNWYYKHKTNKENFIKYYILA